MESSACGAVLVHFAAGTLTIPTEVARTTNCLADDAGTVAVNENTVCKAQVGTIVTVNIPTNGRYSVYLQCPIDIPMCYFSYSNTAGNNMKAFKLKSTTLTNEGDIAQEINTYGDFKFRKSTIYLMFVNMDEKIS